MMPILVTACRPIARSDCPQVRRGVLRGGARLVCLSLVAGSALAYSPYQFPPYPPPGWVPPGWAPPSNTPPSSTPPGSTPPGSTPPGSTPPSSVPPSEPWQFRPSAPTNARGVPPPESGYPPTAPPGSAFGAWGQPPGGYYPGYPPPYARPAAAAPRLELELSTSQPYEQENLVLRVRLIGDSAPLTVTPQLSALPDLLFEQLQGPLHRSESGGVVTEYVFAVTPLRAGTIDFSSFRVSGRDAQGRDFDVRAAQPPRLQVRAAQPTVLPWLPLRTLSLKAALAGDGRIATGQPVTLIIEVEAEGATGSRLPALEAHIRGEGVRVYRERTQTTTQLIANERQLLGRRTEYYTLVPQSGGRLRLAPIQIQWWNVDTDQPATTTLPMRGLQVAGAAGRPRFVEATERAAAASNPWLWLPLVGLALLLLGYWLGVWLHTRRPKRAIVSSRVTRSMRAPAAFATHTAAARATARRILDQGQMALAAWTAAVPLWWERQTTRLIPLPLRLYRRARAAASAPDPGAWLACWEQHSVRERAERAQPGMPLAERLLDPRLTREPERTVRLLRQLEAALYGRADLDFPRWKHDIQAALRPRWLSLLQITPPWHYRRLPALNPTR